MSEGIEDQADTDALAHLLRAVSKARIDGHPAGFVPINGGLVGLSKNVLVAWDSASFRERLVACEDKVGVHPQGP